MKRFPHHPVEVQQSRLSLFSVDFLLHALYLLKIILITGLLMVVKQIPLMLSWCCLYDKSPDRMVKVQRMVEKLLFLCLISISINTLITLKKPLDKTFSQSGEVLRGDATFSSFSLC